MWVQSLHNMDSTLFMSILRLFFSSVFESEICKISGLTICKVTLFAKSIFSLRNYEVSAKVLIYEPWFILLLIQHKIWYLIVCNMTIFWKLQFSTFLDPTYDPRGSKIGVPHDSFWIPFKIPWGVILEVQCWHWKSSSKTYWQMCENLGHLPSRIGDEGAIQGKPYMLSWQ